MTMLDRSGSLPGYFPSGWPTEAGGPRRQKATNGSGPGRLDPSTVGVTTRHTNQWNIMFVQRAEGELYLQGTTNPGDMRAYGWVERVDPITLDPIASSGPLACGNHVWCGAVAIHGNGDLYTVNGSFVHRLDEACQVVTERQLPVDQAHNGFLILGDGSLITKDLRLEGRGNSTVTLLDPDLNVVTVLNLPEPSMGRIAADVRTDGEWIVVPGTEHLFRIRAGHGRLELDTGWRPRYRNTDDQHGLAWDACLSDDAVWIMDNGDIAGIRAIFAVHPNGFFDTARPPIGLQIPTPWTGAQRLIRVDWDSAAVTAIEPFGAERGWIIAPPVHVEPQGIAISWDSGNGRAAAHRWGRTSSPELLWERSLRITMQPLVYPDSGELVVNDLQPGVDDNLVVLDLETGDELLRSETGSTMANGMFLSPGWDHDVYYCSRRTIARVGPH